MGRSRSRLLRVTSEQREQRKKFRFDNEENFHNCGPKIRQIEGISALHS